MKTHFMSILIWCLIDKTWGLSLRLYSALLDIIPLSLKSMKVSNWVTTHSLTLPLLIDQNLSVKSAIKSSEQAIVHRWGKEARWSPVIISFVIYAYLITSIPFLIGLLFGQFTFILVGFGISLIGYYSIALIGTSLSVISLALLYLSVFENKNDYEDLGILDNTLLSKSESSEL